MFAVTSCYLFKAEPNKPRSDLSERNETNSRKLFLLGFCTSWTYSLLNVRVKTSFRSQINWRCCLVIMPKNSHYISEHTYTLVETVFRDSNTCLTCLCHEIWLRGNIQQIGWDLGTFAFFVPFSIGTSSSLTSNAFFKSETLYMYVPLR